MSNVLIGIIGVILFIGLALAGALFLGPRFQQSTNNSKAAATAQAASQIAAAVNMYQVQEGRALPDGSPAALAPGYLKTVPTNPTGYSGTNNLFVAKGPDYGTDAYAGKTARYVFVRLGGTNSAAICCAINQQSGLKNYGMGDAPYVPEGVSGCVQSSYSADFEYYAYNAI